MLKILYYTFLVFFASVGISWMLDNNGLILIKWLGYEVQTDILTAVFIVLVGAFLSAILLYVFTALLSIRFPWLMRLFFRRSYTKKLEKIIKRHHNAFDQLAQVMMAIELDDKNSFTKLRKKLFELVKNSSIHDFLNAKQALSDGNLSLAKKSLSNFSDNKHGKILLLKVKMQIAVKNQDNLKALAYGNQVLGLAKESMDVVFEMLSLYKKTGQWHMAKQLINEYGADKFKSELQKHDITITNTALAYEAYSAKKYLLAIKHSKIAVKTSGNFLPANEIMVKAMIKLGMRLRAILKIRSLWKEAPHFSYGKIYSFLYRKSPLKERIKAMKSLFRCGSKVIVENLLLADFYFHAGEFKKAKELLLSYLEKEKSQTAYLLLANVERKLGDKNSYLDNLAKGRLLTKNSTYSCNECGNNSSKWSAVCQSCGQYDNIEWNF